MNSASKYPFDSILGKFPRLFQLSAGIFLNECWIVLLFNQPKLQYDVHQAPKTTLQAVKPPSGGASVLPSSTETSFSPSFSIKAPSALNERTDELSPGGMIDQFDKNSRENEILC